MNDAELVAAAKTGDKQAFMGLVHRYHGALIATAQQITGNAEDAEDIAQEVVIHAFCNLHMLREEGKFRGWLFAICRRECIDHLRRQRVEVLPLEDCADLPAQSLDDETGYRELLARLPLAVREILLARYFYNLSYEEMAEIFDSTSEAMRTRCFRARAQIQTLVEEDEEDTRRILHGVLGSITAAFPLESFLERISGKIAHLPQAPTPPLSPAAPPAPVGGSAQAGLWATAHLTAVKFGGVAVIALVIAALVITHLPRQHHQHTLPVITAAKPTAIVTVPAKRLTPRAAVKPHAPVPLIMHHTHPASLRRQAKLHRVNAQPAKPTAHRRTPVEIAGNQPQSARTAWSRATFTGCIAYSPTAPLIAAARGFG